MPAVHFTNLLIVVGVRSNGNLALDAAFLAAAGVYAGGIALAFFGVSVGGTGRYREASGREPRASHRLWPGRDKQ